jgi:hypothetical protein
MGTRSLTFVYDSYKAKNGKLVHRPIINLYRQYDGYPSGHGAEIAEFLAPFKVGNGLGAGDNTNFANGMGCLAAQLVAKFKDGAGQFYLYPTDAVDCGQDYEYHIYQTDRGLRLRITDRGCNMFGFTLSDKNESVFEGNLEQFTEFCKEKETA